MEGPTYCLCGEEKYGKMVKCDNDQCPKQWYHLVVLALPPKNQEGHGNVCISNKTLTYHMFYLQAILGPVKLIHC